MNRPIKLKGAKVGPVLRIAITLAVTFAALMAILLFGVKPEQYDIKVGTPAPTQIKASKDIQDTVTTEANRERAAAEVEPSYKSADPSVVREVLTDLGGITDKLSRLREDYADKGVSAVTAEQLDDIEKSLGFPVTAEEIMALVEADDDTVTALFTLTIAKVRETLDSSLPQGQENTAVKSITGALSTEYPDEKELVALLSAAVSATIRPNMLIDEEITEANRQKARDEVQVIWYVKDQEIVSEGQIVTEAQYAMISALGILDEDSFDIKLTLGIALLIALVMASAGMYLYRYNSEVKPTPRTVLLLCMISVLTMLTCLALGRYVHSYLMPVSAGFLMVAILIDRRFSMFMYLLYSLLAAVLAPAGSGAFCYVLMCISGPAVVALFSLKMLRSSALIAGVIIAVVNFAVTAAVGLINSAQTMDAFNNAFVTAGAGLIGVMIALAAQPLFENLFRLATPSKLIELSNPNQPLLRRLLIEASGTYHHSIIVANLSEAACAEIGANALLARVASYYHDIGKLKRPMYFKENQMGDNPHDRTDPRVSTAILTAHPRDGAAMAQKAHMPDAVVQIIREHHGDGPVTWFYDKAIKEYGEENVDIADFRYEGPRPSTREAAVVMLADTIEAATRSLPNPDPEKIDQLIRKLIRGKLNDGQLDNCPLTFSDIDKICTTFSRVLTGVFHERIEYPDVSIPPRKPDETEAKAQA